MLVGTLSLVHKGQTSGCSGCSMQWTQWNNGIWWWGHSLWCKKVKPVNAVDAVHSRYSKQWTQYLHSGCSGCSGIMVYGGGDIVFGAKRSNQWMQYAVDTVDAVE